MQSAYYFSQGVTSSPLFALKNICTYIVPLFHPSIYWKNSSHQEMIELDVTENGKLIKVTNIDTENALLANYFPLIKIHIPTVSEIGTQAISTLIIDVPIYTMRYLYSAPIPTVIALYAILPAKVWIMILPRLFRLLPALIL